MDYIDEHFMNSDASPEEKAVYLKIREIAMPFIDEWVKDPLGDHHAAYDKMKADVTAYFAQKHNPEGPQV